MFELTQAYGKEIFAVAIVVFGFALNRVFRLRPKLSYSVRHASAYPVAEPLVDQSGQVLQTSQIVRTASIVAGNTGLQAASNVEFTFNWKPPIFTVFPGRTFETEVDEMNRWCLR
ncbi:hypothetical protein [Aurantiacibacter luteus]|uniref:hypothetical protein n=1 Tax=Aurantiacibacter luteus TaxID=1581420 RepID=UPI0012E0658D|nr:hypothetical protein [Aurantiacibacter luteus]